MCPNIAPPQTSRTPPTAGCPGLDPASATVDEVKTDEVLYCFADDEVDAAVRSMHDRQVYRLIVLDDSNNKNLASVVSLGDIVRHGQQTLAGRTAQGIAS